MKEFITANGQKKVIINCASMQEVMNLKREILTQLKNHNISADFLKGNTELLDKEINLTEVINFIKNCLISMDISESLEDAIFKCLGHCVYDTVHVINKNLFDTVCPDAREDYYEIIIACLEENLKPFMKSLVSAWNLNKAKLGNIQTLSVIAH